MQILSTQQNRFNRSLCQFINNGGQSRFDKLIGLIWPNLVFRKIAKPFSENYLDLESKMPGKESRSTQISIPEYEGNDINVMNMIYQLKTIKDDLVGAYLHGSLATDEGINYSDFDALVILKSNVLRNPERLARVALKLNKMIRVMNTADPLQHHGWFVLTELDLLQYCDAYFPTALFEFSKSLTGSQGNSINVFPRDSQSETRSAFENLSNAVKRRTELSAPPGNLFELKSLLSQFMLLPSLYLQVRKAKGVFKKHSFQLARADFTEEAWRIMDEVSEIRQNWPASKTGFRNRILSRCPVLWRRWIIKLASPPVPDEIRVKLTKDFFSRMSNLVDLMQTKVSSHNQNA